jgi:hypothetical protein
VNRDVWSLPAISDDGYIAERIDLSLKGAQSDSTCSSDNGIAEEYSAGPLALKRMNAVSPNSHEYRLY